MPENWRSILAGVQAAGVRGVGEVGGARRPTVGEKIGIGESVTAQVTRATPELSWLRGADFSGIGGIGEAGGFRTTTPSWLEKAQAAFHGGLPFGGQAGTVLGLGPTPTETTTWTPAGKAGMAPWQTTPPTTTPEPTPVVSGPIPPPVPDETWGSWYLESDGDNPMWRWKPTPLTAPDGTQYYWTMDEYGEWITRTMPGGPESAGGMTEYERAYLDFMTQQAATQEAARQQEHLAALAADPSRWIELAAYTEKPPTVPEWLAPLYEGQVPVGAPLEEAEAVGKMPLLSKQWWNRLSPAEREQLMGYMTWINQDPEAWMSDLWWMGGQQPFGMGRQFAPFRQYG